MESAIDPTTEPSTTLEIADVICMRCGCLCDDVILQIHDSKAVATKKACTKGSKWFLAAIPPVEEPICTIQGKPATLEEGLDTAAAILRTAKRPLIDGLSHTTVEAQQHAVTIAQAAKGVVVGTASAFQNRHSKGARAVGAVSATWGELRNRADIVIVWNSDPLSTHPRHFERYSLEPAGRFVPNGRADRTLIALGDEKNSTSSIADYVVTFSKNRDFEVATVLNALLKQIPLDADQVLRTTGITLDTLVELIATMKRAKYGVILHDPSAHRLSDIEHVTRAILELVTQLNNVTCFCYSPLGEGENSAGAEQVVAWKTAHTGTVDFTAENPQSSPYEETTEEILRERSVDAALLINTDPLADLEPKVWQWLGYVPTISISPSTTATSESATVAFRSSEFGRSVSGTIFRSDGVALPLRPVESSSYPSDEEILAKLSAKLTKREG
ncbi:hypothetical protein K2Y11_19485 [bacterium]|nr:hypothetical protein [bacterium]